MTEHTPGPLEVQHWKDGIFVRPIVTEGTPTQRVASMVLTERMSGWAEEVWASQPFIDAERIVLTWNCHDDLLEALEGIKAELDDCSQPDLWESYEKIAGATAKAKGQTP